MFLEQGTRWQKERFVTVVDGDGLRKHPGALTEIDNPGEELPKLVWCMTALRDLWDSLGTMLSPAPHPYGEELGSIPCSVDSMAMDS